ncbi:MAG: carboxymuconolactone decarboxylase family protein [Salinarimonadaceae bacterium]|nr:MAG: carboxymuconolactone decarboxylase family protein [Salinarimonadaceae bacterium]
MSGVRLLDDDELAPEAKAVFGDIRAARGSEHVNNFWRALAHDPALLARVWGQVKATMGPGALDPLTKEMIYVAVSIANNCEYCVASHMAAARAKGMSEAQLMELIAVVGLASQTNRIASGLRVPVDGRFAAPPAAADS